MSTMSSTQKSAVQSLITDYSEFELNTIKYGSVKTNTRGGRSIKVNDSKNNTLVLSTPLMLTWGVNKMVDENSGKVSYSMSLQFPSSEYSNSDTETFERKMKEFEAKILNDCVKNGKEWFGKKMTKEVAEALFNPMMKYPKDKVSGEPDMSRPPTMRLKIPYWEGVFNVEFYNMDKSVIFNSNNAESILKEQEFDTIIPKASHMIACIKCTGIWYAAGKFGVTWSLVQSMVNKPLRIQGGCFLTTRNGDIDELNRIKELEKTKSNDEDDEEHEQEQQAQHKVDDSDDEDEAEAEAEPEKIEETPPKKVAKRRVIKKSK